MDQPTIRLRPRTNLTWMTLRTYASISIAILSLNLCSTHAALNVASSSPENSNLLSQNYGLSSNYLLFSSSKKTSDPKIETLLKNSNHNHMSEAINLQLANSVWSKMHDNAQEFAHQRAIEARPQVNRLLEQANVSIECKNSLNQIIERLAKLDLWAVQMYNAFGDFPGAGFFEGAHTSMGNYRQCIDVEPNQVIGKAQYCTFKFQPVLPKRPKFHNILQTIENLANFTSKDDMFNRFASKSHYFYYTKLRLATCMPSKCENKDLELLGEQVAVNTYLQYSGVTCLEKEVGFNPDNAQIFALTVLISLASLTLLGTIIHILDLRQYFVNDSTSNDEQLTDLNGNSMGNFNNNHVVLQQQTLLANCQHADSMLPKPIIIHQKPTLATIQTKSRILSIIDALYHFSIISNGRKLFDTSTSGKSSSNNNLQAKEPMNTSSGLKNTTTALSAINTSESGNSSSIASSQSDDSTSDSLTPEKQTRINDISCVHGLRFWTISWIIFGHTMQYTEWAAFARTYQVEENITSFFLHPMLNASFSVDTFFTISGLLTTYVTWSMTRGQYKRFNKFAFLISRYLRLMPQVMLVVLLFIIFPMLGDGPYWKGLIQKESDNCKENWWISALFLQAFVSSDRICNLVTWWLSIEMFFHLVSIFVIIALLKSTTKGMFVAASIGGSLFAVSFYLHFVNGYPPNMLPTLLQRYEVWDSIVLKYFWTPYPHAPAYFIGLVLGYILYSRKINALTRNQVRYGWIAFTVCYLSILFGTYRWNKNVPYTRIESTMYFNMSQLFWSLSTGWAILACALGHGGWLNDFLSSPLFVPLGRASYMTYLSHMIIVMSYPAKMNLLIEPSYIVFLYIFVTNIFLSYILGIFLTLVYESPILHLQKLLVANMAQKYNDDNEDETRNTNRQTQLTN